MYLGPPIDDLAILSRLTHVHRDLLRRVNGYIAYHGGLHVRGACHEPHWHSLRTVWEGTNALHTLYPALSPEDVPFAQDAVGDQYLLRESTVHRLSAETGEVFSLDVGLAEFDARVHADPITYLSLEPLERFRAEGGALAPGELLSVYPPFCTEEATAGVSLRAVPAEERLAFLAMLAAQIRGAAPDTRIDLRTE